MNPYALNKHQIGIEQTLGTTHPSITPIVTEAISAKLLPDSEPPPGSDRTLALYPSHIDIRMLLQQSKFTIHGTKTPLEELRGNEEFILKIEIPAVHKAEVWGILVDLLSMRQSNLFPDLHYLAQDLKSTSYIDPNIPQIP